MALFVVVLALEAWPMITLIRCRGAMARAGSPGLTGAAILEPVAARKMATISYLQAAVAMAMVFAAVAMARGYGARS